MDTNSPPQPQLELKLQPGSTLVLRMSLGNRTGEAMLLRPTLDDWTVDGDLVLCASQNLEPPYIYLFSGSDASQTLTIPISSNFLPGQKLKTWLRFPGIQEESIAIAIETIPHSPPQPQVVELPLLVTFPWGFFADAYSGTNTARGKTTPISGETNSGFSHTFDSTTAGIFGLISGVIDLDKIPTQWLTAELLIVIAQKGEEYAQTLLGNRLLERLKSTVFFKNGAIALTSAQLPGWISESLAIANSFLGSGSQTGGTQRLLYLWEGWLLSLVETDVESFSAFSQPEATKRQEEIAKQIFVPPFLAETVVAELGLDADRWFGDILLGLAVLSPPISNTLEIIAETATPNAAADAKAGEGGYILATALPGLNFLPVRWLVVELLVVLAQIGNDYAGSETGC